MESQKNERRGRGKGKITFLPHPLPPLLVSSFFTRSLTLVPRSLLRNRTETLATQATQKRTPFSLLGTRGYNGSLSKDFFERRTSTETEAFFLLVWFDTTKFVYLRVFTFTEKICSQIWAKPVPKNAKKTTSGWCAPLKKSLCFNSWITSLTQTLKQIMTKIRKLINCPFFFFSAWASQSDLL